MVNRSTPTSPRGILPALFHHRWAAPVLAELHRQAGSKLVTLVRRLGAPRDSIHRTLEALLAEGWVQRNPGHGHPLRPEYLLTPRGEPLARSCGRLVGLLEEASLAEVGLRKWSMPVIAALGRGALRFSELKAGLEGVTGRALALALKDLVESDLVSRTVSDGYPPTAHYQLRPSARPLQRCLAEMGDVTGWGSASPVAASVDGSGRVRRR